VLNANVLARGKSSQCLIDQEEDGK